MKKLILTSVIVLIAVFPFAALAGNIFWNANATFYNDAKFTKPKLPRAEGTANITYNNAKHEWTVKLKFSGLLKKYNYEFQFGVQDQLVKGYNRTVKTNARGEIDETFTIDNLDSEFENISYPPLEHNPEPDYVGYTILRLLDLEGESGGKLLTPDLEPNGEEPDDNPYCVCPDCNPPDCEYPNATMVMRARQDRIYGLLEFLEP